MSSLFEEDYEDYDPYERDHNDFATPATDSLLPAKESHYLCGYTDHEATLLKLFKDRKMPHALIFSGPAGIGKATFSYRLARFILKYGIENTSAESSLFGDSAPALLPESMDMPPNDPVFRRVISGAHPDFLSLEPEEGKKGLEVDQIRRVQPFLQRTASQPGAWRVVLIDEADTMNRNAQNALLKILEEPPKNTLLILVSSNPASFVPTIRSRCRLLTFSEPNLQHYKEIMKRYDPQIDPSTLDFLFEFTRSSPGKSISFLDHDGMDFMTQIRDILQNIPHFQWEKIHLFSERFSRGVKDEVWNNFKTILLWTFEHPLRLTARGLELPETIAYMQPARDRLGIENLEKTCQILHDHFLQADTGNLDKKEAALEAFMLIEQKLS